MASVFRFLLRDSLPAWLRGGDIGNVVFAIGAHIDAVGDAANYAIRKRYPEETSEDASSLLSADRKILRGPSESWAHFAPRLRAWRQAHQRRGGPYALLEQLHGYWGGIMRIALRYYGVDRTQFTMTTGGVITRSVGTHDDGNPDWARWLLIFYWPTAVVSDGNWGDPGTWGDGGVWGSAFTPDQIATFRAVPTAWGNAHSRGRIRIAYALNEANFIEISAE